MLVCRSRVANVKN